jgi:lipid-binding SYLF domain-containing protein
MSSTSLRKSRPSRLSMEGYIWNANEVVTEALHPRHDHTRAKIQELAQKCKAIVALSIVHVGALLTGHYGTGVIVAKTKTKATTGSDETVEWSAPAAIMVAGYSMGILAGVKVDATLIFIMDDATLENFCKTDQTHLGIAGGLSAGTTGGTSAIGVHAGAAVSFSLTRGVFAGLGLQLGTLGEAPNQNHLFYGKNVSTKSIVLPDNDDDKVKINPASQIPDLHKRLSMLVEGISWAPSDEDMDKSHHFSEIAAESSRHFVVQMSSRKITV